MNQPFQKVQRDIEPGGHDAGDRDGADQLDLPNHLRPRHLPAVQPPSLLWRISGEKKSMMNMIRMNLAGTSFCHVCHDAKTLFLSHHFQFFFRFLTLAQWRKLKPSPSPTFWTSPKNGRSAGNANTPMEGYKYTNKRIQIQIDYKNKHTKITKETERNKFQSLLDQSMEWLLSLNWKY